MNGSRSFRKKRVTRKKKGGRTKKKSSSPAFNGTQMKKVFTVRLTKHSYKKHCYSVVVTCI